MRKIQIIFFFTLIVTSLILLNGCERDDICAESTPTTPRLIIEFYDVANPGTLKSVDDLVIIGEGQTDPLENDNGATISTPTSISLPLRTTDDTTTYALYKDFEVDSDGMIIGGNPDTIIVEYAREDVYVSRACGYKTIFINFRVTLVDDTDNWIQTNLPVDGITNIEDENQAHVNITH